MEILNHPRRKANRTSIIELFALRLFVKQIRTQDEEAPETACSDGQVYSEYLKDLLKKRLHNNFCLDNVPILQNMRSSLKQDFKGPLLKEDAVQNVLKLIQAYIHVNDDAITPDKFANFDLDYKPFKKENLLQLAGEAQNINLIYCICKRIWFPWQLYYLSRKSDKNVSGIWRCRRPIDPNLGANEEIKKIIGQYYWRCLSHPGSIVMPFVAPVFWIIVEAYLNPAVNPQ